MNAFLAGAGKQVPQFRAAAAFVASAGAVLLHLPLPEELPEGESFLPLLPTGLRAFAVYIQAHYLYLKGGVRRQRRHCGGCAGYGGSAYPIPAIYLRLVAVMDYMSLKQTERAQSHLLSAWEMARPDDLIEGFGEHHGLLGAMLGGGHQAQMAGGVPEDHRHHLPVLCGMAKSSQPPHRPRRGR